MRNTILSISLMALAGTASAAPSLIASVDSKGGVNFEFVADKAAPVAGIQIELPLTTKAKVTVPETCFKAPVGFTALCNIDNGNIFKAIVYSTNPDAAIPSAMLGRVALPLGAVSMTKSGELPGLKLNGADGSAATVVGEVLSEGPVNPPRTTIEK